MLRLLNIESGYKKPTYCVLVYMYCMYQQYDPQSCPTQTRTIPRGSSCLGCPTRLAMTYMHWQWLVGVSAPGHSIRPNDPVALPQTFQHELLHHLRSPTRHLDPPVSCATRRKIPLHSPTNNISRPFSSRTVLSPVESTCCACLCRLILERRAAGGEL